MPTSPTGRRRRFALLSLAALAASAGCAGILGFQEGIPEGEAGSDGAVEVGPGEAHSDSTTDSRTGDSTVDSPLDTIVTADGTPDGDSNTTITDASDAPTCPGVVCNGQCTDAADCRFCGFGNIVCPADPNYRTCGSNCIGCAEAGLPFECDFSNACANDCSNCMSDSAAPSRPVECYTCRTGAPLGYCGELYMPCPTVSSPATGPACPCEASADCPGSWQYCVPSATSDAMACGSCGETNAFNMFPCKKVGTACQASSAICQ